MPAVADAATPSLAHATNIPRNAGTAGRGMACVSVAFRADASGRGDCRGPAVSVGGRSTTYGRPRREPSANGGGREGPPAAAARAAAAMATAEATVMAAEMASAAAAATPAPAHGGGGGGGLTPMEMDPPVTLLPLGRGRLPQERR